MKACIVAQNATLNVELGNQMTRRIMLQAMRNTGNKYVALTFISLEEGVLRSSFVERETFLYHLFGGKDASDRTAFETAVLRRSHAVQVTNSMLAEIAAIVGSKVLVIATWGSPFSLYFG